MLKNVKLTHGKMAKNTQRETLDRNPSMTPLTKAEYARTEKRKDENIRNETSARFAMRAYPNAKGGKGAEDKIRGSFYRMNDSSLTGQKPGLQ